ncbi:MAG: DMT family transporter [Candidatus Acidiferrales bacterium]
MLYILLSLMVLAWSANFVIAKLALRELPPFALLFLRVMLSNLILLALYFGRGQHRRRPLEAGDWRWFALLGLFGVALNQTGFTVGLHYTTLAHSSLIVSLTPIYVLLLASRRGLEEFTFQKVLGMVVSFTGVAVLTLEHGLSAQGPTFLGDIITLGGGVAFALYTVYSKQVATRYDVLTLTTFSYLAGAVVIIPLAGWSMFDVDWHAIGWWGWFGVFYMAAVASVAAYMIFYYALTKITASRVIAFSYLQPVLVTILGIIVFGERLTPYLVVGGTLVLVGVFLAERGRG